MVSEIDVQSCIREAMESLSLKTDRAPSGQFVAGNTAAGTTLERSDAFWQAVSGARDAIVARVSTDLALIPDSAPETLARLIGAYAEASLFRESMGMRLMESGGPITNKGKTRALYTAYLSALDRETKLAQVLGLERRARKTETLADVLAQHEERHGS